MEERELTQLLQQLGDRVTPGPAPVRRIVDAGEALRGRRSGRVKVFAVAAAAAAVVGGGSVAAVVLDLPSQSATSADSAGGAANEGANGGEESAPEAGSERDSAEEGDAAADAVDALVVTPDVARPGDRVELTPRDEERDAFGTAWRLERLTADGWTWDFTLLTGDGDPTWGPADERAGEDAPAPSSGPVLLVVPSAAAPGEYRVCRSDGTEDFCGRLTVRR